ncbi:L antigen family member 3-like isoform X1 [Pangasianodon hypophthalmus]|uniref:L antigen family member 3-like isoform X1 n=1 Tax=Pangasianodon hypophthalmus TaxID=310915 RepID=UPI000F010026|nr:L antigen family member 3-like isoform X1 [Pangasianodon hypophthalmus]
MVRLLLLTWDTIFFLLLVSFGKRYIWIPFQTDWFIQMPHSQPMYARTIEVPFPSQREVSIALQSLSPDREPGTGGTIRTLSASANALSVKWNAVEARSLRVSVGSFLDHLALVMETMDAFGQPALP